MSKTGIVLYGTDLSPCVRAVKLTLKALELDYEFKEVNLQAGEHLSEDYLKKNPQHTVPVLDDNGTFLWDSHAIAAYLVDKYGKSDELYPKDLVKRAIINQRMFFEASVIYAAIANVTRPFWINGITEVPQEKLDTVNRGLQLLETFLTSSQFLAGDSLTIADFCTGPVVSAIPCAVDIDPAVYPKITAWLDRLNKIPYYKEINEETTKNFVAFLRSKWTKLGDNEIPK
ncbi:glutathione S-transferase 1-like [Drosophila takahashii]|uniref:glutathione S-transferase 1-like n=1 Tax=Drosophila takahashii TaxID=29030 RepID=UPI0038995FE5